MKNTIITIVILALVLLGIIYYRAQKPVDSGPAPAQTSTSPGPSDSPAAINRDLDEIDLGDLDPEFQDIDADVSSL